MLNYRNILLCLSTVTITQSAVIEANHLDVNDLGYNYYQIIPNAGEKVEIRDYYESLCPACKDFHTTALVKVVLKLGPYLDLKLYPYGNAKMINQNGKIVIQCQHGEAECYGNKLHGCALDMLPNVTVAEEYNACMMAAHWGGKGSTDMDATNCGQKLGINAQSIIDCATGPRGEQLAEYYGRESAKAHFKYVPYTLINGRTFSGNDDEFEDSVCAAFTNKPPACMSNKHTDKRRLLSFFTSHTHGHKTTQGNVSFI